MDELFPVLVAEDDANDVFLLKRALRTAGVLNPVQVVLDGQEAVDYLQGKGKFANRGLHPLPGLIFLDIKMPRQTGFEVLQWIREHSPVRLVPVVVTSSSQLQTDVNRAYELGANAYLIKPVSIEELARLFKNTTEYFASVARPKM